MRRDVIAVAIAVVLAAFLILATTQSKQENLFGIGSGASSIAKLINNIPTSGLNSTQLAAVNKFVSNSSKNADWVKGLDKLVDSVDVNSPMKTYLESVSETLNNPATFASFGARTAKNFPDYAKSLNGKAFKDFTPQEAGKALANFARNGNMTDYYNMINLRSVLKKDTVVSVIVKGADGKLTAKEITGEIAEGTVAFEVKTDIENILRNSDPKQIRAVLKDKFNIVHAHYFEDLARYLEISDDLASKGVKSLPLTRSLWQRITGSISNPAEKQLKTTVESTGQSTAAKPWYKDWKAQVAVGFAVLAGLIIPIAQWLWPKPGSGPGGSTPACDGLCQLLNDPTSAAAVGASSWLSISCCCCCCCLLIISMMGGGKKANNNFF